MRIALCSALSISFFAASALAETVAPLKKQYNEPTRGFLIEHGTVSKQGQVSIDLSTGSGNLNNGGGIRLGLPNSELVISTGFDANNSNSALLKYAMRDFKTSNNASNAIEWALLGGVSQFDNEEGNGNHSTSVVLGAAATISADAGTFTLSPQVIHNSSKGTESDTFVEVDLGAYVGVIDTVSGMFSLGLEGIFTTQDDTDNTFALGARWAYNERVNIDIVPLILRENDISGVPGLVRLNVVF
ncbi:MAG: hypothetical protein ACI9T9_001259 [Oleiphilaceae bacterium]|jgi:hypothetical protein